MTRPIALLAIEQRPWATLHGQSWLPGGARLVLEPPSAVSRTSRCGPGRTIRRYESTRPLGRQVLPVAVVGNLSPTIEQVLQREVVPQPPQECRPTVGPAAAAPSDARIPGVRRPVYVVTVRDQLSRPSEGRACGQHRQVEGLILARTRVTPVRRLRGARPRGIAHPRRV